MKVTVRPCLILHVAQLLVLYKVVLTFGSVGEILKCAMQLKATEQYFPLVFLMVVQKVVLIFLYAASCRSLRNGKPVRRNLFLQCVYHILFTLMSKCTITLRRGPQRFIVICTVHRYTMSARPLTRNFLLILDWKTQSCLITIIYGKKHMYYTRNSTRSHFLC